MHDFRPHVLAQGSRDALFIVCVFIVVFGFIYSYRILWSLVKPALGVLLSGLESKTADCHDVFVSRKSRGVC